MQAEEAEEVKMDCSQEDRATMASSGKESGACSGGTPARIQMGKGK
jgi:hypothetical protein